MLGDLEELSSGKDSSSSSNSELVLTVAVVVEVVEACIAEVMVGSELVSVSIGCTEDWRSLREIFVFLGILISKDGSGSNGIQYLRLMIGLALVMLLLLTLSGFSTTNSMEEVALSFSWVMLPTSVSFGLVCSSKLDLNDVLFDLYVSFLSLSMMNDLFPFPLFSIVSSRRF